MSYDDEYGPRARTRSLPLIGEQVTLERNTGSWGAEVIDRHGRVVGVLVSGGGENLSFAVPVRQLCASLRDC